MERDAPFAEPASALSGGEPFRALAAAVEAGRGVATRLPAGAAAWVGDRLRARLGRPLLVVVPHESEARAWLESLRLLVGRDAGAYFPAPSLSPYQEADVSLGVRAEEVVALMRALAGEAEAVVTTPRALFRRLPDPAGLNAIDLARGGRLDRDAFAGRLVALGYHRVDLVGEPGDFAVRGGVFDLWPAGEEGPIRLDLFGDEIESVRRFEVDSQRSDETLAAVRVLPLALFPAGADAARSLARVLTALVDERGEVETAGHLAALDSGRGFPGWENFLPLAARRTLTLAEALPGALVALFDSAAVAAEIEQHAARLAAEFEARREHGRFAVAPELLEHSAAAVRELVGGAAWLVEPLGSRDAVDFGAVSTDLFHGQLARFPREVEVARHAASGCWW
jgi:transcription-repair coupling factor (superfamily II helicase)